MKTDLIVSQMREIKIQIEMLVLQLSSQIDGDYYEDMGRHRELFYKLKIIQAALNEPI